MKKEEYFTGKNLAEKSEAILAELEKLGLSRSRPFRPENSALLLIDLQDWFLNPESRAFVPAAAAVLPNIRSLAAAFAGQGLPLICTRHLDRPGSDNMMSRWWRASIREDDPLSALAPELDLPAVHQVIKKSQYDAFLATRLEEILNGLQVQRLVICGLTTHLCCESTARGAFMRGFEVFFPLDATATYHEKSHLATLINLAHGFASIPASGEILAALSSHE